MEEEELIRELKADEIELARLLLPFDNDDDDDEDEDGGCPRSEFLRDGALKLDRAVCGANSSFCDMLFFLCWVDGVEVLDAEGSAACFCCCCCFL